MRARKVLIAIALISIRERRRRVKWQGRAADACGNIMPCANREE